MLCFRGAAQGKVVFRAPLGQTNVTTSPSGMADRPTSGQSEPALPGAPNDEALGLELAGGRGHRVRIDGRRCDYVPNVAQLIAASEVAEACVPGSKMSGGSPRNVIVVNMEEARFAEHFESLPMGPEYRSVVAHQLHSGVTLRDLIERKGEGA
jgi:hypothetical protein